MSESLPKMSSSSIRQYFLVVFKKRFMARMWDSEQPISAAVIVAARFLGALNSPVRMFLFRRSVAGKKVNKVDVVLN